MKGWNGIVGGSKHLKLKNSFTFKRTDRFFTA